MLLGNFTSNANIDTLKFHPSNPPVIGTDFLFDDVSCIELDLPAFAGYDYYLVPGDSAFIGRTPDVGINEACTWYQLPNLATPIATIAGMYVKPTNTTTYVVRQEICGLVKWDTVIVFKSAVGFEDLKKIGEQLTVFPVPANDVLQLQWRSDALPEAFAQAEIINELGQICMSLDVSYIDKKAGISLATLPAGIYLLRLKSKQGADLSLRFPIAH